MDNLYYNIRTCIFREGYFDRGIFQMPRVLDSLIILALVRSPVRSFLKNGLLLN